MFPGINVIPNTPWNRVTPSSPRDVVPDQHAQFSATPFDVAAVRLDSFFLKGRGTTGEQGANTLPLLLPDAPDAVRRKKNQSTPSPPTMPISPGTRAQTSEETACSIGLTTAVNAPTPGNGEERGVGRVLKLIPQAASHLLTSQQGEKREPHKDNSLSNLVLVM